VRRLVAELRQVPVWGQVAALRADHLAERGNSEAALTLLRSDPKIDLTRPRDAAALRSLCVHLLALARPDQASEAVEAALAAHPELAAFHEIRGLVLEARPASASEALAAYRRAIELDPEHVEALDALGRLAAEAGDVEEALDFYDRAAAAQPSDSAAMARAAALAADSGRSREAEERWEALLREHPWSADAALQLTALRLARGADARRTLELAQRARRFGGGQEAEKLLARVRQEMDEAGPVD
jgi:tetratricopeptide (TPR) repeat protein